MPLSSGSASALVSDWLGCTRLFSSPGPLDSRDTVWSYAVAAAERAKRNDELLPLLTFQ
jgi:hypothetical protein